jgi:hypothetical protein
VHRDDRLHVLVVPSPVIAIDEGREVHRGNSSSSFHETGTWCVRRVAAA